MNTATKMGYEVFQAREYALQAREPNRSEWDSQRLWLLAIVALLEAAS